MSAPIIKICGITNIEDAVAAANAGANALGFNFYPRSKRYITPAAAQAIVKALLDRSPTCPLLVGVFVNESPSNIEATAKLAGLNIAQLHGNESETDFPNTRVWKALRVEANFDPSALANFAPAEAILLDGPAGHDFGGAGIPFSWSLARNLPKPILIAGGLDASNVAQAICEAQPYGVDTCSGIESAPGRKDHAKMIQFIQAALAAERAS